MKEDMIGPMRVRMFILVYPIDCHIAMLQSGQAGIRPSQVVSLGSDPIMEKNTVL